MALNGKYQCRGKRLRLGEIGGEGHYRSTSPSSPLLLCKGNGGHLKKNKKKNNRMANKIKIPLIKKNKTTPKKQG